MYLGLRFVISQTNIIGMASRFHRLRLPFINVQMELLELVGDERRKRSLNGSQTTKKGMQIYLFLLVLPTIPFLYHT